MGPKEGDVGAGNTYCGIAVWPMVRWCKKSDALFCCCGLKSREKVKQMGEAGGNAWFLRSRLTLRDDRVRDNGGMKR